jgi:hypothetical protein
VIMTISPNTGWLTRSAGWGSVWCLGIALLNAMVLQQSVALDRLKLGHVHGVVGRGACPAAKATLYQQ